MNDINLKNVYFFLLFLDIKHKLLNVFSMTGKDNAHVCIGRKFCYFSMINDISKFDNCFLEEKFLIRKYHLCQKAVHLSFFFKENISLHGNIFFDMNAINDRL